MPFDGKNFQQETKPDVKAKSPVYDLANSKADRLLFMADFMEGLPDEQVWMRGYYERHTCGSAACVIGWSYLNPSTRAVGFPDPMDISVNGWEAGRWFYGLTASEAHDVFSDSSYQRGATGAIVARKLRRYAKTVRAREADVRSR